MLMGLLRECDAGDLPRVLAAELPGNSIVHFQRLSDLAPSNLDQASVHRVAFRRVAAMWKILFAARIPNPERTFGWAALSIP